MTDLAEDIENEIPEPSETKPWWQSKTIIGIAAMLLAQLLKLWKIEILPEEITGLLLQALEFGGAALAVYGRVKARKDLTLTKPGGVFNPEAEVRKAGSVEHGGRGGLNKGFIDADLAALMAAGALVVLALVGCGHSQHGLRVYTPTTTVTNLPDGSVQSKGGTALLASFNADAPGLKTFRAGEVQLDFERFEGKVIATTTDKAGKVTVTEKPIVSGLFTSEVTRAQGEADKSRTDAAGAAGTGVGATFITAPLVGAGLGTIPK
jgi:hypothetical protein